MANPKEKMSVNHKLWSNEGDEKETIASRVKELRKGRQWNQAQLAEKVGVARSQITRLESGETQNVNSDLIVKLAKVFGVTTDYFLCVTGIPHAKYAIVEALGLSEGAARKLASGSIDRDVVNRLLEHKDFSGLCALIRIYLDDSVTAGYAGRNELLNLGVDSLKQYVQEHPDKRSDAIDTIRLLNSQKISADEVNTEKISKSFQHILADIRTDIREKTPAPPPATREAIDIMQKQLAEKPHSQLTPDNMADAMMVFVDSKHSLQPSARSIIYCFFRWFMRYFGGSKHNNLSQRFEAHQEIVESLDEVEKDKE